MMITLLMSTQSSSLSSSELNFTFKNAVILSPKIMIVNEGDTHGELQNWIDDSNKGMTISLSWTDKAGHRSAKVELINIIYNREKRKIILESREWLPYTLSGDIVGLPVVLQNVSLTFL